MQRPQRELQVPLVRGIERAAEQSDRDAAPVAEARRRELPAPAGPLRAAALRARLSRPGLAGRAVQGRTWPVPRTS